MIRNSLHQRLRESGLSREEVELAVGRPATRADRGFVPAEHASWWPGALSSTMPMPDEMWANVVAAIEADRERIQSRARIMQEIRGLEHAMEVHDVQPVSTAQAAFMFGVKPATLRQWVRRGHLVPVETDPAQGHLFRRDDIELLLKRGKRRRGPLHGNSHAAIVTAAYERGGPKG